MGVAGPMCVNRPGAVVLGSVVIRVRVDERSAQRRRLDSQRERDGNDLPLVFLSVRDPGHGVKGAGTMTPPWTARKAACGPF